MKDRIMGALYGMAIGDAMGMPPELWSRKRCIEHYGVLLISWMGVRKISFLISIRQGSLRTIQVRH